MNVRTRFAPSPTGSVHIGNIRVAIFNWLFARHYGGQFLLRIEDTDRKRSTPEAVQAVLNAMEWLGLTPDETPLYQSTRLNSHLEVVEKLLASGHAYREDKGQTGQGEAIVFRMPGADMKFKDEVKGELRKAAKDIPDFVIVRSNGAPVFHLANVVDDIHMGITHVIRGDDHVENTFRHLALYQALGADIPHFAHLPMIVSKQGKPYSKRDGDAYVGDFRDQGYLANALFNYLALLGWNPGDEREIFDRDELIETFGLDRVQPSAAQMDPKKLEWINGEHMRRLPWEEYRDGIRNDLESNGWVHADTDPMYLDKVIEIMGDRIKRWSDASTQTVYFFTDDFPMDEKAVKKRLLKEGALDRLAKLRDRFAMVESFCHASLEEALQRLASEMQMGAGLFIHPVRVATSGSGVGPSLYEMLEVLGRDRVLQRIDQAIERFSQIRP